MAAGTFWVAMIVQLLKVGILRFVSSLIILLITRGTMQNQQRMSNQPLYENVSATMRQYLINPVMQIISQLK